MDEGSKEYLGYLDKEITITGVLSAFPLAVIALVVERTTGAEKPGVLERVWNGAGPYSAAAVGALVMASFFFYRQRSLLAQHYGSIAISMTPARDPEFTTRDRIKAADAWDAWIYYRTGWVMVFLALAYSLCVLCSRSLDHATIAWIALILPAAAAILFSVVQARALTVYSDEEDPWGAYLARLLRGRL